MNITGNLGLTIWDQITDDFDYGQLEDNWIAIDQHDHTAEKGVQIPTAGLIDQAITSAKLALQSVATQHLQNGSVTGAQIANQAVQAHHIESYAITPDLIESTSLTFEQVDPSVVPLGSIMLWWRPPGSAATPGGVWEVMDGRSWDVITNSWNLTSGNIPDMRGRFAMGTGITTGVGIGSTGGGSSLDLTHTHAVEGHVHTSPIHSHGISTDGLHNHTFAGGLVTGYRENAISANIEAIEGWPNGNSVDVTSYSLYLRGFGGSEWQQQNFTGYVAGVPYALKDGVTPMDNSGSHNHGGATANSADLNTGSATSTTDAQLSSDYDITNPYVGLCYIMKCRDF